MPEKLIAGLRRYRRDTFPRYREKYQVLAAAGQRPGTLFIGCADSRVIPELITDTEPGDLFTVRNVGNLVPPFDASLGHHGTAAAIEYAVGVLEVEDIVVCGHTQCGAIRTLYLPFADLEGMPHIQHWLELARSAKLEEEPTEQVLRQTEQRSIVLQIERLLTYPAVHERVKAGRLHLHGWYYDIASGRIRVLDVEAGKFVLP